MTTCASCGHDDGGGRFCTHCGAAVPTVPAAPATDDTLVAPAASFAPPPAAAMASRGGVPRWLPWAAGWALLAVVAATVGWSLGSEADPDAPARTAAASSGDVPPDAPADATDVTASATAEVPDTAPPNRSVDGEPVTYDAAHLLDGDPATAWRMPGDGTGEVLTFTLPGRTRLASVGLVNGYAKVDGDTDWYPRNRRVEAVTWTFDDGTTVRQELAETPSLQTVAVDGVVTSSVTLTLDTVSAPGADGGRDFTPVSDVRLIGLG